MVTSATKMTAPPAIILNQPNASVTGVGVNNMGDEVRTAKAKPIAQIGIPKTSRRMTLTMEPRRSPHQREKTNVNALARLQAKPSTKGTRKRYIEEPLETDRNQG